MSVTELICIICPSGCHLEVKESKDAEGEARFKVSGNTCKRGEKYAVDELTNPVRMVTSTVVTAGSRLRRLPVKTSQPVPKDKISACMEAINTVRTEAPVRCGEPVLKNVCGLNIDIIATRSMDLFEK